MARNKVYEILKVIKDNHLTNATFDRHFNIYIKNQAILTVGPKPSDPKQLEEIDSARNQARNALLVLYSLVKTKSKDREKIISAIRKIQEIDPYENTPSELDITPAHIDSAVLYSIEDILYPKKTKFSPKKAN